MNANTIRRLATSQPPVIALRRLRRVQNLRAYATPATIAPQEKDPQLGDYPQLPFVSRQLRPPKGWWDEQERKNFGETLPEKEEILSMWGPDIPVVPPKTALYQFGIAICTFAGIAFACSLVVPERDAIPREYPFSGLVKELGGLEENRARSESEEEDE